MQSKTRVLRALALTGLLLAALGISACAGAYVNAGDNPGRITVTVTAQLDKKEVDDALWREQLIPPFVLWGINQELRGPYWDWGLYLVGKDGSYNPLQPEGQVTLRRIKADLFSATATFLTPPGTHRLHLLVDGYYEYWSAAFFVQAVSVKTYTKDQNITITPGQTIKQTFNFTR